MSKNELEKLKILFENRSVFENNGPASEQGSQWLAEVSVCLNKINPQIAKNFDYFSQLTHIPLSSYTIDPILNNMMLLIREAIILLESTTQEKTKKNYSNGELIEKIGTLREKINNASNSNKYIGFSIFPPNETIYLQLKTANNEATLMKACVNLREIIQNLNKDDLGKHGLNYEEIKKLLPDTAKEDINKSINKLFLYLSSKKFNVDNSIFGLTQLNQIVGLLGSHPKNEKEKLIKKLENAKLEQMYKKEEWGILHQNLLEKYINSLNLLLKAIDRTEQ